MDKQKVKPEILSLKLVRADGDVSRTFFNGTLPDAAAYYKTCANALSPEEYDTKRIVEIIVLNKSDEGDQINGKNTKI